MFTGAGLAERSRLEMGRGAQLRDRSAHAPLPRRQKRPWDLETVAGFSTLARPIARYRTPYNACISRAARGPLVPTECILLQLNEKAMCASGSAKPMEPPRPWWPKERGLGPMNTAAGVLSRTPSA